jgi:(1->4)-alpha-D-glucan 1-alpha-D-glucosylmutase
MTTPELHVPSATYRLQFNKDFTFRDARDLVPYLSALGITHIYASPYFKAAPGSSHGYDICDHNELNPELGTAEDFEALVATLRAHRMGQIVDFVPNHMGIVSVCNGWWQDVLENGPSSVFAPHFDIDWNPVKEELEGKVLLPILGDQFGRVLERGEFRLEFAGGAFFVRYFETRLPVAPRSYSHVLRPALEIFISLGASAEHQHELQSIMTALEHLPDRTETDPAKVVERMREKEIIKRRLVRRCDECPEMLKAINEAMRRIEGEPGNPRSFDAFDAMLSAQIYRLSYWRVAAEEINYRRFFDVNTLAAIRMELPGVFEAAHQLVFDLIARDAIHGLRIDHVDGLCYPGDYLRNLQRCVRKLTGRHDSPRPLYLVVEKILIGDERLPASWPVHGTTGYDFTNEVAGLFVDPLAEASITDSYRKFLGELLPFSEVVHRSKVQVMHLSLASEMNMLGHMLQRLAEKNRWYRDFTLNALTDAIREVIAGFPVYRTYVAPNENPSPADRDSIMRAVRMAKRRNPGIERSVFDFLSEILFGHFPENLDETGREEHMRFVLKFQQCTGPIMAKGLEDTAFYIFNRLAALNEVGGEPQRFGYSAQSFHHRCKERLLNYPHGMLATSTHDTKRGEDVRMRIAAISELSEAWRKCLRRWSNLNHRAKRPIEEALSPDPNEEYLLYQTLLGTWPWNSSDRPHHSEYVKRIQEYMIKAIKEAKINSSWIQPQEDWEEGVSQFVERILQRGANRFIKSLEPLAEQVAQLGMVGSLSQTVLKCSAPGVPDFFQGSETWDLRLVDPDNRRPVDYDALRNMQASLGSADPGKLFTSWRDGRIKLYLIQKLLRFRSTHRELFQSGAYVPLNTAGRHANSCVAFARHSNGGILVVAVARLTRTVGFPPVGDLWADTRIPVPPDLRRSFTDLFTGKEFPVADTLMLADVFATLPVAALWSGSVSEQP